MTSTRLPDGTAVAAETTQVVVSAAPSVDVAARAPRARGRTGSSLPVLIAIVAILGYPLYQLVVLSFQQYGLAELIQHKGAWVGLGELHAPSSTTRSSGTRCCARSSSPSRTSA